MKKLFNLIKNNPGKFVLISFIIMFSIFPPLAYLSKSKPQSSNNDSIQIFEHGKFVGRNAMFQYIGKQNRIVDGKITIELTELLKLEDSISYSK
jgi:hypothetical protein